MNIIELLLVAQVVIAELRALAKELPLGVGGVFSVPVPNAPVELAAAVAYDFD